MRLTTFTDYALRVLMYAAATGDRLITIEETAKVYDVSHTHLMKVVNVLKETLNAFFATFDKYTLADLVLSGRDFKGAPPPEGQTRGPDILADAFMSDIGGLFPMALCGRTSLYNSAAERPRDRY